MSQIIFILALFISQISINHTQNDFESHIVGGQRASEGQFPHVVSLRWAFGHFCGGAILNERFILSASHCWWFLDITHVIAGAVRLNDTSGVRYDVIEKIDFPGYNFTADPLKDDIGLLRVDRNIQFTWNIQPIPINRNRVIFNIPGMIAGWGHTTAGPTWGDNFAPTPSNDLRFIYVNVLSHRECERRLSIASRLLLNRDHICTFANRGVGVCTFDSGSPVIVNGEVVGVVAFVVGCAIGFPDWGPRVSSYSRWIDNHIN